VPTLALMLQGTEAGGKDGQQASREDSSVKFTPIDLSRYFNASSARFGPRERAKETGGESAKDGLLRPPGGEQRFLGIPFALGPEDVQRESWLVLSQRATAWSTDKLEIPLQKSASHVCLAAFCDWDENETPPPGKDVTEKVGQRLAELVFLYEDGSQQAVPIRRRFEVNSPSVPWGHLSFAALPPYKQEARKLTDPLSSGLDWGHLQRAVYDSAYGRGVGGGPRTPPPLWVSALTNPEPAKVIKSILLRAASDDPVAICGLTLFHGRENPLRYGRLSLYRLTLPEAAEGGAERWKVEVDLGILARAYALPDFRAEEWLATPRKGQGEVAEPMRGGQNLYVELTASPEATLKLIDAKTAEVYEFDLGKMVPGKELEARRRGARIEILETEKVWLHGQVLDSANGRPTAVRLAFRSKEGRYIPPYGHRTEINDGWFQDYGADVKLADTSFAYVDGTFQVELPIGEVYVEITKGLEYEPVRQTLEIKPGQRELKLGISRHVDLRARGWVTADTHVHWLSPSTAVLEGQAEGLNVINLLAAHLGDLFINVGDLTHGPLTSRDGETIVSVGTENREHILGHLGLLGGHGEPVYPMSAGGPSESYLGDPLWNSMADWADGCHRREGIVVAVHFPYPTGELAADIVMGKIDAVELVPFGDNFNTTRFLDWYRYLNCGYRVPAVGGTDKAGAYIPVGAIRTYAYLGQEQFDYANWVKAVRQGNTFMTTGPLLLLQVDGHPPGDEIKLGAGGGTVEVQVEAKGSIPFHQLEVVLNGQVVCSREDQAGTRQMALKEKVKVSGSGWLAARCASRLRLVTVRRFGIQAHTSPVYLSVPGQELFSPTAAVYMLTLIEGVRTYVEELATRPDADQYARILNFYREAREHLEQRLRQHGSKP
jgi:hypothetical protein